MIGPTSRSVPSRHQARSRQASSDRPRRRRAAPASIGSTATAPATGGTATRPRTPATSLSCPTMAASRGGAARVARPAKRRRTTSAVSWSAGTCPCGS